MSMKIGIISDSHDNMPLIARAVDAFNGSGTAMVLHAGDIISPFTFNEFSRLKCEFAAVFGNNDGETKGLAEKFSPIGRILKGPRGIEAAGSRIVLMHEPGDLESLADKYDIIIYGHTHIPEVRKIRNATVINPGECGGWLYGRSTVAILELPGYKVDIVELK
jgi:uncharacterized protein